MTACEKCWSDSSSVDNYRQLLESRKDHPCTPEQQAGPDANECPKCKRQTLHQHTRECMAGCAIEPLGPAGSVGEGGSAMRIKTIVWQNRREFNAIYECDYCGYEHQGRGYDDATFHDNVIPKIVCPECGATATTYYRAPAPRHPGSATV